LGPDFVHPEPPSENNYTRAALPAATVSADGTAQQFTADAELGADWWRLFKSAQLDAIVGQAIANSQTLQASEATLRQSQDNLRAGHGVFFPKIDAEAAATRQRTAPLQQGLMTSSTIFNLFTLSGTISYPLDIFGGERRAVEGLRAQAYEQYYATKAAYLTLSANVVDAFIARAAYAAEIRTTEQLIDLEIQQLQLAQAQVSAGTSSFSSVLSVRGLIATNKALLAPLRQKVDQADDLLATLRGVVPSKAAPPDIDLAGLTLPVLLPVSLPSDLVQQRPDILSAEEFLHAASANIGVATSAMFPSFSLNAAYGASGSSLGRLPAASGRFWSIGPSATVPIFQGGGLWYSRKAAIDAFQAAQAYYRQTVLAAFAQVSDSLTALEHDAEALQAEVDVQRAAKENLYMLQANYRAGLVAFSDVLTADVQLHETTIGYLQAVAQRHQDTVALFVSLGGGWWNVRHQPAESIAQ
jgi:NodT family efflux transporter outer membrane factor (OMF) lipoprotein